MGRFDVYRFNEATPLVVEVQADLLSHLGSVVVIPLRAEDADAKASAIPNLTPLLHLAGGEYRLLTTDIGVIPRTSLGERVARVENQRMVIVKAIDFLLQGF